MTTELEKQFFKVFGIDPDCTYLFLIDGNGENKAARTMSFSSKADLKRFVCECGGKGKVIKASGSPHIYYPEITDRILLKLICKAYCLMLSIQGSSIELLKESILREFIYWQEDVDKSEIQQLFKEEE